MFNPQPSLNDLAMTKLQTTNSPTVSLILCYSTEFSENAKQAKRTRNERDDFCQKKFPCFSVFGFKLRPLNPPFNYPPKKLEDRMQICRHRCSTSLRGNKRLKNVTDVTDTSVWPDIYKSNTWTGKNGTRMRGSACPAVFD